MCLNKMKALFFIVLTLISWHAQNECQENENQPVCIDINKNSDEDPPQIPYSTSPLVNSSIVASGTLTSFSLSPSGTWSSSGSPSPSEGF